MKHKILVTDKEKGTSLDFEGNNFNIEEIREPLSVRDKNPQGGVAYLFTPNDRIDFKSAWDLGSFMYKVCFSREDYMVIVPHGIHEEIILRGYSEIDKLRSFEVRR